MTPYFLNTLETLEEDMPGWIRNVIIYATTPAIVFPAILLLL